MSLIEGFGWFCVGWFLAAIILGIIKLIMWVMKG